VLASTTTQQKSKKKTRRVFTFSSSRHHAKMLYHGLFSLRMLFVGIGQSFFIFFALASADFCNFSALALVVAATS
jgi:hypothetical protein